MKFAITLHVSYDTEPCDTLNHSYIEYFERLGVIPILMSNVIADPLSYIDHFGIQGLILTGGNDISPKLYGQNSFISQSVSVLRDQLESTLLKIALERYWPVLGICRGMHFINVFFGGGLIPNLQSYLGNNINHAGHSHLNRITDSKIERLLEIAEYKVNSFHNQGIIDNVLSPEMRVFVVSSSDRLIEGIIHPTYPILGVQWHPERTGSSEQYDICLIQNFLKGTLWD